MQTSSRCRGTAIGLRRRGLELIKSDGCVMATTTERQHTAGSGHGETKASASSQSNGTGWPDAIRKVIVNRFNRIGRL